MDKRSDRHKKQKTLNPKYKGVDYPPYESPIFLEDNPEEAEKLKEKQAQEARLNAQKEKSKQYNKNKRPEAIRTKDPEPEDEYDDEYEASDDDYIYQESIGEKIGNLFSNKYVLIGIGTVIAAIIGISAWAALSRPADTNNNATGSTDSAVTLSEEEVSEALASTKDAILSIQEQLNPAYLYNSFAEGIVSSQIKNTQTGETLTKNDSLFQTLNYDPTKDLAGTNDSAFRTEALPLYTQSFLSSEFDPAIIDNAKTAYAELELPSRSSLNGDDQGYDAIKDAYQNINVQISALEIKTSIESKLNNLTITPVYTAPTINTAAILKDEIPADTLTDISSEIAKLESSSENQKLVVALYNKAFDVINDQQNKINDAKTAINTASNDSTDRNIKAAEAAIKAVTSKTIQDKLTNQLSNAKDTLAKNNELDEAIKEQDKLKESLQKEYDEKIAKINDDHQKAIDELTKTKDQEYTKKVEDMTNEKNEAVQAAKDELQRKINTLQSENAQLQQSNTALQEANKELQNQINELTK